MTDFKTESLNFVKTLGAIAASYGVVWVFVEPMIIDYLDEHLEDFHKEDKILLEDLKETLEDGVDKRNEIVDEIHYIYPNSRLKKE